MFPPVVEEEEEEVVEDEDVEEDGVFGSFGSPPEVEEEVVEVQFFGPQSSPVIMLPPSEVHTLGAIVKHARFIQQPVGVLSPPEVEVDEDDVLEDEVLLDDVEFAEQRLLQALRSVCPLIPHPHSSH